MDTPQKVNITCINADVWVAILLALIIAMVFYHFVIFKPYVDDLHSKVEDAEHLADKVDKGSKSLRQQADALLQQAQDAIEELKKKPQAVKRQLGFEEQLESDLHGGDF